MRVLIAGGGIGGLAAALACSRAGCAVDLFEKATAFEAIGAGIQLGPNVTRILHAWGLEPALKDVAAYPDNLLVRDANTGNLLGRLRLGDAALHRYGSPYATVHRADLHALLLNAVKQFPQTHLQLDSEVASFAQSGADVSIAVNAPGHTSKTLSGDVLIGADGLWSQVRSQLRNDGPPHATGHVAYRAMLLQKDLPADLRSNGITAWLGPKMHAVQYPVRGGEWLNVVVIVEAGGAAASNSWNQVFSGKIMPQAALDKRSQLSKLLQYVATWQAWPLCARAPMRSAQAHFPASDAQNKVNTRVALLGDAAHPMLPYLAQGAGMAIEDADGLATCLAGCEDVRQALQNYAQNRWQRNARVQARAIRNGRIFHATGLVKLGRNLAMKMFGERILDLHWLYAGP